MNPLQLCAKSQARFSAAEKAGTTWLIGQPGKIALYQVESKPIAMAFLTRSMTKQGFVVYQA